MSSDMPSLTVRQAKRREIALDAQLAVGEEQRAVVRLAASAVSRAGWFLGTAVDISEGGMGVVTETFLPRGCATRIRLLDPLSNDRVVFEALVRIKRIQMLDRRPAYLLGAVFDDMSEGFEERLAGVLRKIDGVAA